MGFELVTSTKHCKTQGFFRDLCVNFTRRLMVVTFPCTDWLSYLRTQLKLWVECVCEAEDFFRAVLSNNFFCFKSKHFKES